MERKSIWKNFLLLVVGGLLVAHLNVASAQDHTDNTHTSSDASDECVLEGE